MQCFPFDISLVLRQRRLKPFYNHAVKLHIHSRQWQASSRRLIAPRASPSPQREYLPVLFTQHDQRHSAAASDMISFDSSDNQMWRLQTWKSYWALWLTPPSCRHLLHGTPDSERMKGTCLLWMSLWSHISAHPRLSDGRRGRVIRPSRAEPHLHTLNAPTQRLDKPLQRFTRWLSSRAPSTRCLYALKWSVFSTWCQDRDLDPVTSDVSVVLSFLHETPRPRTVPPWDLPTVLRALKVPPFEPLQSH